MRKKIKIFILCMMLSLSTVAGVFAEGTENTDAATSEEASAAATSTIGTGAHTLQNVLATLQADEESTVRLAAENDVLALYIVNEQTVPNIILVDKRSGHEWMSWCPDGMVTAKMNKTWTSKLKSLFNLYYVKFSEKKTEPSEMPSADATEVNTTDISNGVRIEYNFSDLSISLAVEITLDEDSLLVSIPVSSIVEEETHGITSIEMMPLFGASASDMPGYILYPDGSGAIIKNKNYVTVDKSRKYSWEVYGEQDVAIDNYKEQEESDLKQAMVPVFGVKQNNNAFVAVVTKGEGDSIFNLYPSGYIMELNRMSTEFIYRRFYNTPRQDGTTVVRSEKQLINQDHTIKYIMISDGDKYNADYSGMANAYRNYLLDNELLNNALENEEEMPFALDLFMGVKEDSLLFDKYIAMTTYDEAIDIYTMFNDNGINNIMLNLVGWMDEGYGQFPDSIKASKKLGGASGLEELVDHVKGKNGRIYLQMNPVDAYKSNGGFSTRNDVIYTNSNMLITDVDNEEYIINPIVAKNNITEEYADKLKKYGVSGISIEKIGQYLYNDYNKKYPLNREQSQTVWQELMNFSKTELGSAFSIGGNAYMFKDADRLSEIPISDSGYFVTDQSVPFYQMVVHGYIPYTSKAANLFHDAEKQLLQWIEYGCIPYYELTYNEPSLMKNTEYNELFTSYYEDWIKPATDNYNETKDRLGDIWKEPMVGHEEVAKNVFCTQYGNGDSVYVNYNSTPVEINGYVVDAVDYLVVKGGGAVEEVEN